VVPILVLLRKKREMIVEGNEGGRRLRTVGCGTDVGSRSSAGLVGEHGELSDQVVRLSYPLGHMYEWTLVVSDFSRSYSEQLRFVPEVTH
jgi:hypothetical protein